MPANAREAIVRIGLLGGVGEVSFDDVQIHGALEGEKTAVSQSRGRMPVHDRVTRFTNGTASPRLRSRVAGAMFTNRPSASPLASNPDPP